MEDCSRLLSFERWPALCDLQQPIRGVYSAPVTNERPHLTDVFARAELAGVVDHEAVGAGPQDPGLRQRDAGATWGECQHPVL